MWTSPSVAWSCSAGSFRKHLKSAGSLSKQNMRNVREVVYTVAQFQARSAAQPSRRLHGSTWYLTSHGGELTAAMIALGGTPRSCLLLSLNLSPMSGASGVRVGVVDAEGRVLRVSLAYNEDSEPVYQLRESPTPMLTPLRYSPADSVHKYRAKVSAAARTVLTALRLFEGVPT